MNGQAVSAATIPSFMRSMRSDMLFFFSLSIIGIGCSLGRLSFALRERCRGEDRP
jgi:hypothetical protein